MLKKLALALMSFMVTPALVAISRVVAPSKERSEKRSAAAATIRSRVASADGRWTRSTGCGDDFGMPAPLINRTGY